MASLHEAKILGYSTVFITKSGRSNWLVDLFLLVMDGVLERMETGVISKKKKKKVNTCLPAHFVSLLGRKLHKSCIQTGFDLFFFLEITPNFIISCLTYNKVWTPVIRLFCFSKAKSGICHEKSRTYGNPIFSSILQDQSVGAKATLLRKLYNFTSLGAGWTSLLKCFSSWEIQTSGACVDCNWRLGFFSRSASCSRRCSD